MALVSDAAFVGAMQQFTAAHGDVFTKPQVSTITLSCVLDAGGARISLDDIRDNPALSVRTRKGRAYRPFSNAATVVFDGTKTIKVFKNLVLHITGVTSIDYAHELVKRLKTAMGWQYAIQETRVLTLNAVCALAPKRVISLEEMRKVLAEEDKLHVRYTPDIYQGLVLKAVYRETGRKVSVLCFYTGSFIVCGVKDAHDLWFGLMLIGKIMRKNLETIAL